MRKSLFKISKQKVMQHSYYEVMNEGFNSTSSTLELPGSSWFHQSSGVSYRITYGTSTAKTTIDDWSWLDQQESHIVQGTSLFAMGDPYIELTRRANPPLARHWPVEAETTRRAEAMASAKEKARLLLKSMLTPEEWAQYEMLGIINVRGQSGQLYRLHATSSTGAIRLVNRNGVPIGSACCHPVNCAALPIEDVLIAQKLHLECNEAAFMTLANVSDIHGRRMMQSEKELLNARLAMAA